MADIIERLQLGLADHRAGRLAAAEASYRAILAEQPDEPHALHYLGLLTLAERRPAEALDVLSRAASVWPEHDGVRIALGRALLALGRTREAIAQFQDLAARRPLHAAPLAGLALARLRADDPAGAMRDAQAALALDAASADGWFALGTALAQMRRPIEAVAALDRAVASAPGHAEAHLNLGNALFDLDRLAAAEAHLRRAVALDPALAEAHASLGCLLSGDGRLDEAVAACATAIDLRPDFAQAHWNQSFAHMLAGDYAPGWEKYEWRKRHDAFARHLMVLPGPEWRGEPLAGRTILVRAEQGLGDTIQFARYLVRLVAAEAAVVLVCARPLVELLRQIAGVTIVAFDAEWPAYDVWIDQMSLPRLFGTRPHSIPCADGYLVAEPARVARWADTLADGPPAVRVGLVWAGNRLHSNDRRRSMAADALAPLLATPGCRFVSLQVGPGSGDAAQLGLADHAAALTDLAETAALIAALDLVVTVDSCVAHLAGALGVPVWIMLPFAPDWRWMILRTDTPWYASARLFRQSRAGDWRGVVERVAAALASLPETAAAAVRPRAWPSRPTAPCAPASRTRPAASRSPAPA